MSASHRDITVQNYYQLAEGPGVACGKKWRKKYFETKISIFLAFDIPGHQRVSKI